MQELWERTLELRIRAQKAMTMAHRLPKVRRNCSKLGADTRGA